MKAIIYTCDGARKYGGGRPCGNNITESHDDRCLGVEVVAASGPIISFYSWTETLAADEASNIRHFCSHECATAHLGKWLDAQQPKPEVPIKPALSTASEFTDLPNTGQPLTEIEGGPF